jgi:hypothetical protein
VIFKQDDLPSGKNHADYIDEKGKYDIVKYMQDHKEIFFGTSRAFNGTIAHHITTEADCKSPFSQQLIVTTTVLLHKPLSVW